MKIFGSLFKRKPPAEPEKKEPEYQDPLDARYNRLGGWDAEDKRKPIELKKATEFPMYTPDLETGGEVTHGGVAMDSATISANVQDTALKAISGNDGGVNPYVVPGAVSDWYISQSFIGYQSCAIIAQHWLVNKACSMAGKDAVRKGWEVKSASSKELSVEAADRISEIDTEFKVIDHLVEAERFKNIFGIRVVMFVIDSPDPDYYSKPFNLDGIRRGSYKGISQIDPYWMMPMMTAENTSDPSNMHFYEPEYWVISGQRYHRSHLIVLRNDEPADILKPTYLFGGIPLVQQIYERVYAAERTANEAPLLAMSKRLTTFAVDIAKALLNETAFKNRIELWTKYRDNHGVKLIGKDEKVEQFDINLSDFDSIIMNQYQLVSSIAKVPSTKLLGTSPKGFNATGEFEMVNYHEELETIQKHDLTPILDRHYLIMSRHLGFEGKLKVIWEPVGSMTAKQKAEINAQNAETGRSLIESGVISPDEERQRLRDDRNSGYNRLTDEIAEETPGLSPQNMALLGKSAGEIIQGKADIEQAKSDIVKSGATYYSATGEMPSGAEQGYLAQNKPGEEIEVNLESDGATKPRSRREQLLIDLAKELGSIDDFFVEEGKDIEFDPYKKLRTVQPSVKPSVRGSVNNLHSHVGKMAKDELPKMKMHGMMLRVENPRNSVRRGDSVDGSWSVKMPHHYGFIQNTMGADGDEIDCFIGPNPKSKRVFIINQKDSHSGDFDEHKVMLGFDSPEEARAGYDQSFSRNWDGFDSMHEVTPEQLKSWSSGDASGPYSPTPLAENAIVNETTNAPKPG